MYIKWISEMLPNQILLPLQVANKYGTIPFSLTLHFGAWKTEVNAELRGELPEDTIALSPCLSTHFKIPDALPYDMYIKGNHLYIGPVIAFLISNKELTPRSLNEYRGYFRDYEAIKGLIYMCSVNGINPKNKTVHGYYYNPQAEGDASWIENIFPYPGAVYRRTGVNKNIQYDDLIVHAERKIFNPYFLNKWELWESIRSDPFISDHMPCTKLLDNLQSLKEMLALYGSVYLKPAKGSFGIGIFKAEKTPQGYLFINRRKVKKIIKNEIKTSEFLKHLRKDTKYLIQQSVALTYQNMNVDFRVIMQKDGRKNWTCSGIIARYGQEGRIYTNDVSSISEGKEALVRIFQFNDIEASRKEEEIVSICTKACEVIEKTYGPFGDVGIDIVVDPNLKVWILEINSCHQHTFPSYLKDNTHIYNKVLTRPFEYAKSLADFTEGNY